MMSGSDLTRRELAEAAVVTGRATIGGRLMPEAISPAAAQGTGAVSSPIEVVLRVNGTEHRLAARLGVWLIIGGALSSDGCESRQVSRP